MYSVTNFKYSFTTLTLVLMPFIFFIGFFSCDFYWIFFLFFFIFCGNLVVATFLILSLSELISDKLPI